VEHRKEERTLRRKRYIARQAQTIEEAIAAWEAT